MHSSVREKLSSQWDEMRRVRMYLLTKSETITDLRVESRQPLRPRMDPETGCHCRPSGNLMFKLRCCSGAAGPVVVSERSVRQTGSRTYIDNGLHRAGIPPPRRVRSVGSNVSSVMRPNLLADISPVSSSTQANGSLRQPKSSYVSFNVGTNHTTRKTNTAHLLARVRVYRRTTSFPSTGYLRPASTRHMPCRSR